MASRSEDKGTKSRRTASTTADVTDLSRDVAHGPVPAPGLILAWSPPSVTGDDRAPLGNELVVGRSSHARWCLKDRALSRRHFSVSQRAGAPVVEDRGSHNGTFINGSPLVGQREIHDGDVLRAGNCVFLCVDDLNQLAPPCQPNRAISGIAGRFYAEPFVERVRVAAGTRRGVLLAGPSGSGKELAAAIVHQEYERDLRSGPLLSHNAAFFAGEDDAVATLFGVREKTFTNVETREGALEAAKGGTLFLDEVHNLPLRVQRSLLRFLDDGCFRRLGTDISAPPEILDTRLIFGTNIPIDRGIEEGRLAPDLVSRLTVVSLPSLRDRRGDIPSIFEHLIRKELEPSSAEECLSHIGAKAWELLCLQSYARGNVRQLEDMVALIRSRLERGESPRQSLFRTLYETLEDAPLHHDSSSQDEERSVYLRNRDHITRVFQEQQGNLSRTEKALRSEGIKVNRKWLTVYLERWGLRNIRRRGG